MAKTMKTNADQIAELMRGIPLWAHRLLVHKGTITWKLSDEEVFKRGLQDFTCGTCDNVLVYRPRGTNTFIIRLMSC